MAHPKIKYTLITLLLIFIFSESCSTNSRSLFEKRKYLKGWHFHKKTSASQKSSNAPSDITFKKKNDVLNVRYQKNYSTDINVLKVRKSRFINTNTVEKELIGFRSSSNNSSETSKVDIRDNKLEFTQPIEEGNSFESNENLKKSNNQWRINGAYFFLLMIFPLAFNNRKRKEVQVWAARNKNKSRALLVIAKVLLAATSIGLGFLLGAPFSLPLLLVSVGLLILSIALSEYWSSSGKMTQKKNLGILGVTNTSTSFGFFSLGGMLANGFQFSEWSISSGLLNFSSNNPDNELVYNPGYIIAAIILLTFFLIVLLIFIGWLSCYFYCSGSETLGVLLFVLGALTAIFGYVYLISQLFKRENEQADKKTKFMWAAIISVVTVGLFMLFLALDGFFSM